MSKGGRVNGGEPLWDRAVETWRYLSLAAQKTANVVEQAAPANVSRCVSLQAPQADEEPQNSTLERISRAVVSGSRLLTPILAFLAPERKREILGHDPKRLPSIHAAALRHSPGSWILTPGSSPFVVFVIFTYCYIPRCPKEPV